MELPLFPLHVVLFPGTSLPLQVFELRYRAMMEKVLSSDRRLGIVAIRHGMEVGGPAETYPIGCLAEVESVQRLADGTMTLTVGGRARFHIDSRLPDDPFPRADVSLIEETQGARAGEEIPGARAAVMRYISVVAQLQGADVMVPPLASDPIESSFRLAASLHVDIPERQRMLEAPDASERLKITAEIARKEALLLDTVGPSVGRPGDHVSLN